MIHFGGLIPKNGRNIFAEMSIHSLNFSILVKYGQKVPEFQAKHWKFAPMCWFIELDDGKIYRKALW